MDTDRKKLGDLLLERRIELKKTRAEVAVALGCVESTILKYEDGEIIDITPHTLSKLAIILELDEKILLNCKKNNGKTLSDMDFRMKLSIALTTFIEEHDISNQDFVDLCNTYSSDYNEQIHASDISRYIKQVYRPTIPKYLMICKAMNKDFDYTLWESNTL